MRKSVVILILPALLILFNWWIFPALARPEGQSIIQDKIPDVRFFYQVEDINRLFASWGETGRSAYRRILIADMFYPLVYGALLIVLIRTFYNKSVLYFWPVLAVLFDYLENAGMFLWMYFFPEQRGFFRLVPYFTLFKWLMIGMSLLLVLYGLLRYLYVAKKE